MISQTQYLDEMEDVKVEIDVPDLRVISLRLEKEDLEKAKALARTTDKDVTDRVLRSTGGCARQTKPRNVQRSLPVLIS